MGVISQFCKVWPLAFVQKCAYTPNWGQYNDAKFTNILFLFAPNWKLVQILDANLSVMRKKFNLWKNTTKWTVRSNKSFIFRHTLMVKFCKITFPVNYIYYCNLGRNICFILVTHVLYMVLCERIYWFILAVHKSTKALIFNSKHLTFYIDRNSLVTISISHSTSEFLSSY